MDVESQVLPQPETQPHRDGAAIVVLLTLLVTLLAGGCATRLGPSTIPAARFDYNDNIARSQNDQLLLNLVRLKYRDTPVFLDVGAVIAQYTLSARAGAASRINVDGVEGNELGLDLGGNYSEQPTITYEPLQGADFTQRLLTPISPFNLILLSRSGWSIERLLLCCVDSVNGITNAPAASGPTPTTLPDNARFRELARLMRELQVNAALDFQVIAEGTVSSASLTVDRPTPDHPQLPTLQRVREILHLGAKDESFNLTTNGLPRSGEISLAGRSLLGVLFFLSHGVDAPQDHVSRGLVTVTASPDAQGLDWSTVTGNLLHIRSSASVPPDAFTRIRYRNHWYSIEDSDLQSKATFSLLTYLFSLQAAGTPEGSPLLTVPVAR